MTFLAWIIVACTLSFGVFPFFHSGHSYWHDWKMGNLAALCMVIIGVAGAVVIWAFVHLLQVYVA
jgi:hypothetical protein